jgi:catechol 2,3-dioxygenase-like lactoylglutathione lyase family enzyme
MAYKGGNAMEANGSWQAGRIPASAMDHVAYNVPNIEDAVEFFTQALGCQIFARGGPVDREGITLTYALVRYDPTTTFELLEWRQPGGNGAVPGFTETGGGHLAFRVPDLDGAIAVLSRQPGIQIDGPEPIPDGRQFLRFTTSFGMTLQLLGPHPSAEPG